jgi:hypothetical protein
VAEVMATKHPGDRPDAHRRSERQPASDRGKTALHAISRFLQRNAGRNKPVDVAIYGKMTDGIVN